MQRDEILKKIQELVSELEQTAEINEETILVGPKSNVSLSSLDFISAIVGLEDFYQIKIPEEEIEKRRLGKVAHLIDYIIEKKQ